MDGRARGIVTRDLVTGADRSRTPATPWCWRPAAMATSFYLSTNAKGSQRHRDLARVQARRGVREPVLHADSSDLHPGQRRAPVEAHADERVVAQRRPRLGAEETRATCDRRTRSPQTERDYYLERKYPSFGNLAARDIASRAAKEVCDEGRGVGPGGRGVYLDFADAIKRLGEATIRERYGNLFEMYERITGENPYRVPMRIYPAVHYTMGGLWVDYDLMSTIPGLFVLGEANFSDHGANRLGASALMQGLADGYFIMPYTIGDYLAGTQALGGARRPRRVPDAEVARRGAHDRSCSRSAASGRWTPSTASWASSSGRTAAWRAPTPACGRRSPESRRCARSSGRDVNVPGSDAELNQALEKAGRVADFLELGELMCPDALHRDESCGGHFREESQTPDGEAQRDDANFAYVAAWEYTGEGKAAGAAQGAARRSKSVHLAPAELQVNDCVAPRLAPEGPRRPTGRSCPTTCADASPDMSFLEMLDVVNERLIASGEEPIAFDHDCREGICGSCGMMINGVAHGPHARHRHLPAPHAQLPRRRRDRDVEPWRAAAFPVIKDLVVDRSAFDRIIAAGGFISAQTGSAPDGNAILVPKRRRRRGDGRGGVHRLRRLRGRVPERLGVAVHRGEDRAPRPAAAGPAGARRAACWRWSRRWIARASATARCIGECQAACPKAISIDAIARMNRDWLAASIAPEKSRNEGTS